MLDVVAVMSMLLGQGPMALDYSDIEFYPRNWREWVPDSLPTLPRLPSSFEQFIPAPVLAWLEPYRRPDAPPPVVPLRVKMSATYMTVCQQNGGPVPAPYQRGMAQAVNDIILHPEPWLAQAMEDREYIMFWVPRYEGQTPRRELVVPHRYEAVSFSERCEGASLVRRIALPGVNPPNPAAQLSPPVEKIDGRAPTASARPQQAPTPLVPGAGKKNPVDGLY